MKDQRTRNFISASCRLARDAERALRLISSMLGDVRGCESLRDDLSHGIAMWDKEYQSFTGKRMRYDSPGGR